MSYLAWTTGFLIRYAVNPCCCTVGEIAVLARWSGSRQIFVVSVVATAPGVSFVFGIDTPPVTSGIEKLGRVTLARSGPLAWPGTLGGAGAAAGVLREQPVTTTTTAAMKTASASFTAPRVLMAAPGPVPTSQPTASSRHPARIAHRRRCAWPPRGQARPGRWPGNRATR